MVELPNVKKKLKLFSKSKLIELVIQQGFMINQQKHELEQLKGDQNETSTTSTNNDPSNLDTAGC